MQRISAFWTSSREKPWRSSTSTVPFRDVNAATRRHVREDYWPATLDRETEKAARILHSFCTEGYIANHDDSPGSPRSSISSVQTKKKIPPRIVQNAVGLAIFSCMRSGMWKSGSGGSGILVARKSDGRWSPPSGLLLHTAALGFVIGVDVYDCVLVINSMSDLETFTQSSTTLGADVELAVGPVMSAGHLEKEVQHENLSGSVLTYVKARGEHRAVNIDGSLVTERVAENHRFYGSAVSVIDILSGQVPHNESADLRTLYEVIKSAEGRVDFDAPLLEKLTLQPAPGDALIENPAQALSPLSPTAVSFGVPDVEDPDPFGVKALEMAGLEIKEAGTRLRPSSSHFEFNPSPTSPLFGQFKHNRQSTDTFNTQSNSNRASYMSSRSIKTNFSRMTDAFTQTTVDTRGTTPTSEDGRDRAPSVDRLPVVMEPVEVDYTQVDDSAIKRWSQEEHTDPTSASPQILETVVEGPSTTSKATEIDTINEELVASPIDERDEDADDEEDDSEGEIGADTVDEDEDEDEDFDEDEEEPVVFEVYEAKAIQPARPAVMSSQATQVTHAKGALVNIPKRIVPAVPPRSPARSSKSSFAEIPAKSPLRNSFPSSPSHRSKSSEGMMSMNEVVIADREEAGNEVTPTSPVSHEHEVSRSEPQRLHGEDQHNGSIVETVIESRLSLDDVPKTPSTLQTSGNTSSGDEHEPRTPKAEDDVMNAEEDAVREKFSFEQAERRLVVESN